MRYRITIIMLRLLVLRSELSLNLDPEIIQEILLLLLIMHLSKQVFLRQLPGIGIEAI